MGKPVKINGITIDYHGQELTVQDMNRLFTREQIAACIYPVDNMAKRFSESLRQTQINPPKAFNVLSIWAYKIFHLYLVGWAVYYGMALLDGYAYDSKFAVEIITYGLMAAAVIWFCCFSLYKLIEALKLDNIVDNRVVYRETKRVVDELKNEIETELSLSEVDIKQKRNKIRILEEYMEKLEREYEVFQSEMVR